MDGRLREHLKRGRETGEETLEGAQAPPRHPGIMTASEATAASTARFRNLTAAREAYAAGSAELSREAHSLLADSSTPKHASTWSPWLDSGEAGHNEQRANSGASLLLRGALDGVTLSLMVHSFGDAAGWPNSSTVTLNASFLACWAAYSACREALDVATYTKYYKRERSREAWGELPSPAARIRPSSSSSPALSPLPCRMRVVLRCAFLAASPGSLPPPAPAPHTPTPRRAAREPLAALGCGPCARDAARLPQNLAASLPRARRAR